PAEQRQRDEMLAARRVLAAVVKENDRLAAQLAQQRGELDSQMGHKAVLIGWSATGAAADFVPTPLHARCPGVVVHGAVFNAVMTNHFWRRMPGWVLILITLVLGLLTAGTAVSFSAPRGLACALMLLIGYLLINGLLLFGYF